MTPVRMWALKMPNRRIDTWSLSDKEIGLGRKEIEKGYRVVRVEVKEVEDET